MVTKLKRRGFMSLSAGVAVGSAFAGLAARQARAAGKHDYGPLGPTSSGPDLLLPRGFHYEIVSLQGRPMADGYPSPHASDGMGAFALPNGNVALIRNHEDRQNPAHFRSGFLRGALATAYGPRAAAYDPYAGGGCTILEVEPRGQRRLVRERWALVGTTVNCAGGITPWDSWITCEETTDDASETGFGQPHGYAFEVPLSTLHAGPIAPVPLRFLGRFDHEAVAVDPHTLAIYETEDAGNNSGFYRWLPPDPFDPGELRTLGVGAGTLQMMRVKDPSNPGQRIELVNTGFAAGATFEVEWVDILDRDPPAPSFSGGTALAAQGLAAGASRFARLEGIWYGDGTMYFQSTSGGAAGRGQVWAYDVGEERLTLVFESPGIEVLDSPDNICVSPSGNLVICEDGSGEQFLRGLTREGAIFDLARSTEVNGSEFAGACFSPDGDTLFVAQQGPTAVQDDGSGKPVPVSEGAASRTYAIHGPWKAGPLG
jgi:uncharacterized protein